MEKPKFQLNPDGSIVSDDLDAILELQRRLLDKPAQSRLESQPKIMPRQKLKLNGRSPALDFLRKLPAEGKKLDAGQMASIVGAKNLFGVGPKLRKLGELLEAEGMDMSDYISTRKTDTGSTIWAIRKTYP